jgi:fructokinase
MSVVCLGEVLLDRWPDGRLHPGGAPANVAFHAGALGAPAVLVSRVGSDAHGMQLRHWLAGSGVNADLCRDDARHPTGLVEVGISPPGAPFYDIMTPAAWDFLEADGEALSAVRQAGVLVFGTLAQRHPVGRRAVRALVEAARGGGAAALADLNLRAPFFDTEVLLWTLRHCDVLKLNGEELGEVSRVLGASGSEEELFVGLLREFDIARGVLTTGGDGAWIFEEGKLVREPAVGGVEVVDPVGAGDAFCAALAVGLASGKSLRESAPRAARAAAFVVSRPGATPRLPAGI